MEELFSLDVTQTGIYDTRGRMEMVKLFPPHQGPRASKYWKQQDYDLI